MKEAFLVLALLIGLIAGSWVGNLLKFIDCDFEPSYKEEIIYGVGLLPIVSIVTVWYDKEDESND